MTPHGPSNSPAQHGVVHFPPYGLMIAPTLENGSLKQDTTNLGCANKSPPPSKTSLRRGFQCSPRRKSSVSQQHQIHGFNGETTVIYSKSFDGHPCLPEIFWEGTLRQSQNGAALKGPIWPNAQCSSHCCPSIFSFSMMACFSWVQKIIHRSGHSISANVPNINENPVLWGTSNAWSTRATGNNKMLQRHVKTIIWPNACCRKQIMIYGSGASLMSLIYPHSIDH